MCCLLRVNSLFPMANESSKSSMHNNDLDTVESRFSKRKFSKLSRFSKLFQGDRFFME